MTISPIIVQNLWPVWIILQVMAILMTIYLTAMISSKRILSVFASVGNFINFAKTFLTLVQLAAVVVDRILFCCRNDCIGLGYC